MCGWGGHICVVCAHPFAGRKWDPAGKCWRVKRPAMETVIRHLTAKGFRVVRPGEDTPAKQQQQQQAGAAAEDGE
jgi:hypothetical protein